MKKLITITCILCFFFYSSPAMNTPVLSTAAFPVLTNSIQPLNLSTLKIKEVEKLLGRKLSLKEKIGLKLFQWKIRKELKNKKTDSKADLGKTAMILGIVGIGLLIVPYLGIASIPCAILAIIFGNKARKANKNDGKAQAGIILGWVTLGLILLAIALVVIIVSTWSGWRWG